MATNKLASIRYRVLDQCFRDFGKRYFIDDLRNACIKALDEYADEDPNLGLSVKVSEKTIYNDIRFMKSEAGWSIELDPNCKDGKKLYYRYLNPEFSINNFGLNREETGRIKDMVVLLSRFRGLPAYDWVDDLMATLQGRFNLDGNSANVIGFEQNNKLKGLEHLSEIIDATTKGQVLDIEYPTKKGSVKWTIHPYYVKQFHNRWYLLGLNNAYNSITNVALDRIISLNDNSDIAFLPNTNYDFEHYFDNVIGVTIPNGNTGRETVVLKFSEERFPMVLSKPIHPSQKKYLGEPCSIQIDVIPNKELEQEIFSFGKDVEVISPQWLRDDFAKKVQEMVQKYIPLQL